MNQDNLDSQQNVLYTRKRAHTMDEYSNVLRGKRASSLRVDDVVQTSAVTRFEEGMPEAWQRRTVKTPKLLLSYEQSVSYHTIDVSAWIRTSSQFLFLFLSVARLELSILDHDRKPGHEQTEQAEAEPECVPECTHQRRPHLVFVVCWRCHVDLGSR